MSTNTHIFFIKTIADSKLWVKKICVLFIVLSFLKSNLLFSTPCNMLSPQLSCVSVLANGDVKLTWATPSPIDPAFDKYFIYKSSSLNGPYTVLDSIPSSATTSYTHIGANAIAAPVYYYIKARCIGFVYSASGDTLNSVLPATPIFDTLSVDNSNLALLSWNKNPSINVKGYAVYKFNGAAWLAIDTVFGINNTSFNYTLSTAVTNPEQFRLAAFDGCPTPNLSPLTPVFTTIHLTASADICKRSANISWTAPDPPHNIESGLTNIANYLIYQSTMGQSGPYSIIGTVPAGTQSYTVSGLAPNATYYFKIGAVDASGTKTVSSNRITFYSATPAPPAYLYLRKASVSGVNRVDLTCHVDIKASISNYKIFRALDEDTIAPNYTLIGTIPASATTPITFTDTDVNTNRNRYYYKIMIVDSCGYDGIVTNIGHTILLTAVGKNVTLKNNLKWSNYEIWSGGVSSYNIYRSIDDDLTNFTFIANVSADVSGINTYTDDVSAILTNKGIFNYYIEAVEGSGDVYGFMDNCLSNIAQAYQDPIIYIPNAFEPDGNFNKVFKPVISYVDFTEYEFSIFDRLGAKLFSTTNIDEGWDGTYAGNKSGWGVYVYLIKLKTARGDYKTLKGSLTLLR